MNDTVMELGQRLHQSRDELRQALLNPIGKHAADSSPCNTQGAGSNGHGPSPAPLAGNADHSACSQALQASPALSSVATALHTWWSHHPMRASGWVAAEAAAALVKPLAQRHPVALVVGAFGVGALLVWSKPWSWSIKPAVFASLVPPLASWTSSASSAVSAVPIAPWMSVLNSLVNSNRTTAPASPDPMAPNAPLH
jgi:hypothetical protein